MKRKGIDTLLDLLDGSFIAYENDKFFIRVSARYNDPDFDYFAIGSSKDEYNCEYFSLLSEIVDAIMYIKELDNDISKYELRIINKYLEDLKKRFIDDNKLPYFYHLS